MTTPPPARRELKRRRTEIESRLKAAGLRRASLAGVPRWLDPQTQSRIRALPAELRSLGPLFCRFGRYLSTRLDHISGADCRDLAALPDHAEPFPEAEIRGRLRSEFGRGGAALRHIEAAPVESLALSQTQRGWLDDGRLVSLKLARTEVLSGADLAALPHLAHYLSSLGWPLAAARRVIADFQDLVARRLDLRDEAEMLGRLASLRAQPQYRTPRVVHSLSAAAILTVEVSAGATLFSGPAASPAGAAEAAGHTRALADLWMHVVFNQRRIPEELQARDLRHATGGALELTGGLFYAISAAEVAALWRYVLAAARDDSDAIFEALRDLTEPTSNSRRSAFRHQLGHVVPRRDGRFGEIPPGFPELLLSHWPQAEKHGFVPGAALRAFYRGLVGLRALCGPSLSHAVLRESLQVVQISRGSERLRKALDPSVITRSAESAVQMLTELPRTLERISLSRKGRSDLRSDEDDAAEPARDDWATLTAALLVAATLVLWFQRSPTLLAAWTAPVQALLLTLLGAAHHTQAGGTRIARAGRERVW